MNNVFEGPTDERQSPRHEEPVSRFRPRYRALFDEEKFLHDQIKQKAVELEELYVKVKPSRYNSLAITSLEESIMWIVKGLTA